MGVVALLKKVLDLPKENLMQTLKASRGTHFWDLVRFGLGFLRVQTFASKLKDASEILSKRLIEAFLQIEVDSVPSSINIEDFPPEVQEVFKALKVTDLSFFERANIEKALPLQHLIQASTHS